MGVWLILFQSPAWHLLKFKYNKVLGGQQQCTALDWGVFQPLCGTTCMVMGVSGSVTTSFPPPVIHDSNVFFLPHFMLTPSYVFTPSITSHFSFSHSLLPPPPCLIHGVGWYSDRPNLWSALHHLLPSQSPIFMSQTHQKGCGTHRFFFVTHTLCNWVLVVRSRVRDQGCNVVHLLPIFCPRLHYEHGGREPQHRHKHRDRGKKNKAVSFSFFCAVPFRWCSLINGRITGSRLFWFH